MSRFETIKVRLGILAALLMAFAAGVTGCDESDSVAGGLSGNSTSVYSELGKDSTHMRPRIFLPPW